MVEKVSYASNVISEENTIKVINYTLDKISNSLSKSLGPYGSHTILQDGMQNHTITKDGYTIFDKIGIENDISKTILQIIKKISKSLVKEVGDGSTSSVIIACKLYEEIKKFMNKNKHISPKTISDILNELEIILTDKIKESAIKIDNTNFNIIEKIASVSNNNDRELGSLIRDVYIEIGKNGFITLENSNTEKTYYKVFDGYEVDRGYIMDFFLNNKKTLKFESDSPLIFVTNSTLNEKDLPLLADISGYCLSNKKSLVIVAKEYTEDVINFLQINKIRNKDNFDVCPIDFVLGTDNRENSLEDFCYYIDATLYDKLKIDNYSDITAKEFLGSCDKVIIDEKYSKFIKGHYNEKDFNDRIKLLENLKEELKNKPDDEINERRIFEIEKRISKLQCNNATIFVGGKSEMEKTTKKYLMDDAINAVRSALDYGYVIGGNLIIPLIIENNVDEIKEELINRLAVTKKDGNKFFRCDDFCAISILSIIYDSFNYAYYCVLMNCFNDKNTVEENINTSIQNKSIFNLINFSYEDINETDVINSANTDIQIMKSAFSIIGLLVTSNQFISLSCYNDDAFN